MPKARLGIIVSLVVIVDLVGLLPFGIGLAIRDVTLISVSFAIGRELPLSGLGIPDLVFRLVGPGVVPLSAERIAGLKLVGAAANIWRGRVAVFVKALLVAGRLS